MIGYLTFSFITFLVAVYIGMKLGENIENEVLYFLFWVLYIATIITISNVLATMIFYDVLKSKRGPPGIRGPVGDQGGEGGRGRCRDQCKSKVCHLQIMETMEKKYNEILNMNGLKIRNKYLLETVKRICHSEQFTEVTMFKAPTEIITYLADIGKLWIQIIVNADGTPGRNKARQYLETNAMGREFEAFPELDKKNTHSPWHEIEKYDVFYWGLDRELKPMVLQYCADPKINKAMPQGEEAKIKAIKTNIYKWTWCDEGTGSSRDGSVHMPKKITYDGRVYYPLGMVGHNQKWPRGGCRYAEEYYGGSNKMKPKKIMSYCDNHSSGVTKPTILVSGDERYVQRPKSMSWTWNDDDTGGDYDVTHFDGNRNFYDPKYKKWFRCFGSTVRLHKRHGSLREPDDIRCIADECLEPVNNYHRLIWNDRKSGGTYDGNIRDSGNSAYNDYNLSYFHSRGPKHGRKFYKIKKECLLPKPAKRGIYDPLKDDRQAGLGYHGSPEREAKYSIFQFLNFPVESIITNKLNAQKLYIRHSGLNDPNSFLVKILEPGDTVPSRCLTVRKDGKVFRNNECSQADRAQLWEVRFAKGNKDEFVLRNKKNGNDLRAYMSDAKLGPIYFSATSQYSPYAVAVRKPDPGGRAKFYYHGIGSHHLTFKGNQHVKNILHYPGWNDNITAVTVDDGIYVKVYQHINYQGREIVLHPGKHYMPHYNFNDTISSMKIIPYPRLYAQFYTSHNKATANHFFLYQNQSKSQLGKFSVNINFVYVPKHLSVYLYDRTMFRGNSIKLSEGEQDLRRNNWNSRVKSIKVSGLINPAKARNDKSYLWANERSAVGKRINDWNPSI